MSNGPEFFKTGMGRKFYEADVPRIADALERIATAMEKANEAGNPIPLPMSEVAKEFMGDGEQKQG